MPQTDDIIRDLAPTGRLRATINLGNPVLAQRGADGTLGGVSVAIAREAARRLGLPLDLFSFDTAGLAFAALRDEVCDMGFLAIDPERAEALDYSAGYVRIEGTYLVRAASDLRRAEDLDREGLSILTGRNTAYDLYLSRTLTSATIVHAATSQAAIAAFLDGKADACAGVRQPLAGAAAGRDDVRVLADAFQTIDQAVALPRGRPLAHAWLGDLVETLKASGFIAEALRATGQDPAAAAPVVRP